MARVFRLLAAIGAFQTAFFAGWTAVTVHVLAAGWSPAAAGTLAAVPWLAVLATLPATPRLARRHGLRRVALAAAGVHVAAAAAWTFGGVPGLWLGAALLGAGFALRWTTIDAWLIAGAGRERVARVVALAETIAGGAMLAAPLLAERLPPGSPAWAALAVALLAVLGAGCIATLDEPRGIGAAGTRPPPAPRGVLKVVAVAAVAGGAFESGFMAAGPLLAAGEGLLDEALRLAALVGAGSFLLMLAFGALADRAGAARVLLACSVLVTVALGLLLAFPEWLLAVAFVLGAGGGGLYTIAIAYGAQRTDAAQFTRVVAAGGGAYTAGSLLSPLATGWLLEFGTPALATVMLAAAAAIATGVLWRVLRDDRTGGTPQVDPRPPA